MKKKLFMPSLAILAISLLLVPVGVMAGKTGKAGKSHVAHLYLFEKDPTTWEIVEGGAWGMMKYIVEGAEFEFVFNGHGLEPGEEYTLIYYPDKDGNPWPRVDIICLGEGAANGGGNIHIAGSVDTGDLPNPDTDINDGAKIWLVLSEDVDCEDSEMFGWRPTEYLFEYDLITFDDIET